MKKEPKLTESEIVKWCASLPAAKPVTEQVLDYIRARTAAAAAADNAHLLPSRSDIKHDVGAACDSAIQALLRENRIRRCGDIKRRRYAAV